MDEQKKGFLHLKKRCGSKDLTGKQDAPKSKREGWKWSGKGKDEWAEIRHIPGNQPDRETQSQLAGMT